MPGRGARKENRGAVGQRPAEAAGCSRTRSGTESSSGGGGEQQGEEEQEEQEEEEKEKGEENRGEKGGGPKEEEEEGKGQSLDDDQERPTKENEKKKKKRGRIMIGIMGLIEEEWIDTLYPHDRDHIVYQDFVQTGREMVEFFERRGCDLVVALTHMRWNNDERLAREVRGIDLILGGHDHVYATKIVNQTAIIKSGSDFREFSSITLYPQFQLREKGTAQMVPPRKQKASPPRTPLSSASSSSSVLSSSAGCSECLADTSASGINDGTSSASMLLSRSQQSRSRSRRGSVATDSDLSPSEAKGSPSVSKHRGCSSSPSCPACPPPPPPVLESIETRDDSDESKKFYRTGRWFVSCERVDVSKKKKVEGLDQGSGLDLLYEPDEKVFEMLASYQSDYSLPENEVLGVFPVPLETRFSLVRREECNSGNWLTDLMREAFYIDVALYNSGGIRSDCLFNKGELITNETLNALLSGLRELCIIDVEGSLFKSILENSVSRWPQLEGRFLHVSGLRFAFRGFAPVGDRVVREEIRVYNRLRNDWEEVDMHRLYSVILPRFLVCGGDGFTMFSSCGERPLRDETMKNFLDLSVLTRLWLRLSTKHSQCPGSRSTRKAGKGGGGGGEEEEEEEQEKERRGEEGKTSVPDEEEKKKGGAAGAREGLGQGAGGGEGGGEPGKDSPDSRDFFMFQWVHRVCIEEKNPRKWRIRRVD